MSPESEILIEILAAADAAWLPLRTWSLTAAANVGAARAAFAQWGVHRRAAAPGDADRKSDQRRLANLVSQKLVVAIRPTDVKTTRVRLTPSGDAAARVTVGLPGEFSAWLACRELSTYSARPPKLLTDCWIAETRLAGVAPDWSTCREPAARLMLQTVENLALPALTAGLMESASDVHGRVRYALTRRGWDWINNGRAPKRESANRPTDPDAIELYSDRLASALSNLLAGRRVGRDIGLLPLPASVAGLPLTAAWAPTGITAPPLEIRGRAAAADPIEIINTWEK